MKTNKLDATQEYEEYQKKDIAGLEKSFLKYRRYWKWFVVSIVISLCLAVLYLKRTSPTYEVKAKILLENTSDDTNPLRGLGIFNIRSNVDNEQEILNTSYLMELVVRKLEIYAQYHEKGTYRNTELYGADCPINVRLAEATLNNLRGRISLDVEVHPNGTYYFMGEYKEKGYKIKAAVRDSQVLLPFGMLYFNPGILEPKEVMTIGITLDNPSRVADNFLARTDISLTSKTTSVINMTLKTNHIQKGTDFINTFLETYKDEEKKDQNSMAENTTRYLDNLLASLGNELNDVEKRVESFKQSEGVSDINSEAQLYIQRTGQYEQRRLEVGTQLGIIKDLEEYINKNETRHQLLPSGIGLQSSNLNTLISEYNNLLLERKRLSRTATESNQAMIDLTDRIDALFRTVQSSLGNEKRNLMISQQDLVQKNKENAARIQAIPRQERAISDLSRQQNVKSQLYLLLLQKRDENYLNMAASAPKFKVIGYPRSNGAPVAPKSGIILIVAIIGGLFLPVFGISIHDMIHYTIENKDELKQISAVPILGEIPRSKQKGKILIQEHSTDGFTEMFRLLRTNLMFVLNEPSKKVINIVSSVNGEGKTLLSINLALCLAFLDKKVLIINLDVRKPKMEEYLGIENKSGITEYLSGQITRNKLIHQSGVHPNLWTISSGPVPPNPNELLAKHVLDELITVYREQFNYIIVDTPPVGAVSDSLLLNRFADANIYIVRADYTPKNAILDANELFANQSLKNMYFVLNAVDLRKASNRSYGYRKKYGYGYGYYSSEKSVKLVAEQQVG